MTNSSVQMALRRGPSIIGVLLAASALLLAQEGTLPEQGPPPGQLLSQDQLANMVAPVALYPDSLLSQVLVAATYPLEIAEAAQWLQENRNLQGSQLVEAARQQNWDASIQALVVFPDVLNRLNSDIRWTTDLGNAFLAQQADVMNAVQDMRAQARSQGKLRSNPQEIITDQTQGGRTVIEIQPADPQVVYVPSYNPEYIWGPPAYGYYPPLYYPEVGFGFGFGPGIYIGSFFGGLGWGGWGWGPNWFSCGIVQNNYFFNRYGFNRFHGRGFEGGRGFGGGRGAWAHDPGHRLGVPYPNRGLASRFGGASSASRGFAGGQFGGRTNYGGNFGDRRNPGAGSGSFSQQRGAVAGGTNRSQMNQPQQGVNSRGTFSRGGANYSNSQRAQTNGTQGGGWQRFGQPAQGARQAAPSYSRNGNYGRSPTTQSYRASPAYGGGSANRSTPSYSGGSSYGGNRPAQSYRSSPAYAGGSANRSSPSYSGGSSYGGNRPAQSYRSSPAYAGGSANRSSPSYSGNRSTQSYRSSPSSGGGGAYRSSASNGARGGGGSYHGGGGGSSSRSSGGGGSSHGGRGASRR
jgi:hypothetical protein